MSHRSYTIRANSVVAFAITKLLQIIQMRRLPKAGERNIPGQQDQNANGSLRKSLTSFLLATLWTSRIV